MSPRLLDLAVHVLRLAVALALLLVASSMGSAPGMVVGAGLFFLNAFALTHDLMHGALGLPRGVNEVLLSIAGGLLLMSGHALRRSHLVHHARPLADDDLEGRPACGSLAHAIADGPRASLALRVRSFEGAGARGRAWQATETAVNLAALVVLVASGRPAPLAYALVALTAQATMGAWAAHVPHNAPAWLTGIAARLTWTGSPTLLSLAHHDLHHARPRIPCRHLRAA
jgi:fatty acid desaturase